MGAFNGFNLRSVKEKPNTYSYFQTQTAFRFFKGFGVDELVLLLASAEAADSDTVWVPKEDPSPGHIGLSTWYVRALVKEHFGDECNE